MYPWQDDNALFFKLAHIDEPAGYFGPGPIGNGLTKYAHTPFVLIYNIFGHNTVAYFGLLLILYIVATIFVYKSFSVILGETGGRVAGFLFGAGYVISDGIWRMANSATTSLSIIFISLFLIGYWKFHNTKKIFWYFLALVGFFLASEITIVRTHYFFAIVVLFEVLFLTRKNFSSIVLSIARLVPFFYIFKNWALAASSSRTGEAKELALAIFNGQIHLYYGFLSSITNLVIPDWFTGKLFFISKSIDQIFGIHLPFLKFLLIFAPSLLIVLALRKNRFRKFLLPIILLFNFVWVFVSKDLFVSPLLTPTIEQNFIATLGGSLLLIAFVVFISLKKQKNLFLFLILWALLNVAVYSAYNPTFQYGTVERYMTHSFVALTGIFGVIFLTLPKTIIGSVAKVVIVMLGVGNLIAAVLYQNTILHTRSFPAREFYEQLRTLRPSIEKGDVLYFDVAHDQQRYYNDAISTAMMPETTAFAWRYGIDRYDIKLTTDFNELEDIIEKENIQIESVNTFWYSKDGLVDTTPYFLDFADGVGGVDFTVIAHFPITSETSFKNGQYGTIWSFPDLEIDFNKGVRSSVPLMLEMNIVANSLEGNGKYPLTWNLASLTNGQREFWNDTNLRNMALEYGKEKEALLLKSKYKVASEWQNNRVKNLKDDDIESLWQSERTGWGREFTFIEVELPKIVEVNRVVWINGFSHNTPTKYRIEVSDDGINWHNVKEVNDFNRIDNRVPQVISFEPTTAQFVRMVLLETLNGDSPVVAEFWVVPSKFSNLDITLAEEFLKNPMALVPNSLEFSNTLSIMERKGSAQIFWESDKKDGWQTTKNAEFDLYYDGIPRVYKVGIPAGGSKITRFKISNYTIPGSVEVRKVNVNYANNRQDF